MIALLRWLAVIVVSAGVGFFLSIYVDFRWVAPGQMRPVVANIDRVDMASIAMTAATLALGASALVVTVLGVVGARAIRAEAIAAAKKSANEAVKARLDAIEPTVREAVTKRLDDALLGLGANEARDLNDDYDPKEGER